MFPKTSPYLDTRHKILTMTKAVIDVHTLAVSFVH